MLQAVIILSSVTKEANKINSELRSLCCVLPTVFDPAGQKTGTESLPDTNILKLLHQFKSHLKE